MTSRRLLIAAIVGVPLIGLVLWIASNTDWVEEKVPMPPRGEARTNPFYAAQRFAEALGARTSWDRIFTTPPSDGVIVLSTWQWNLSDTRRTQLERWVEGGGRLVVDSTLVDGDSERFQTWSGIVREYREDDAEPSIEGEESEDDSDDEDHHEDRCREFRETLDGHASTANGTRTSTSGSGYTICKVSLWSFLTTTKQPEWALRNQFGIQVLRVPVGRGSVTVINATPFLFREMLDGDHARLFAAATQLRRHDEVLFLSGDRHASLLALIWRHGAPAVVLGLVVIALALWRGGVRFGPLAAPDPIARRSLAEQIRGTGQFALRHGGGDALHAACVRALEEAAQRRVTSYPQLTAKERVSALARLTGLTHGTVAASMHDADSRGSHELRRTIARLEAARRRILARQTEPSHGTHRRTH